MGDWHVQSPRKKEAQIILWELLSWQKRWACPKNEEAARDLHLGAGH
jgi:hypothetical protein